MAGESARESARRMRERADRIARAADKWERGADGERRTAEALRGLPSGWTVLHDLPWPGRPRANIDHLAVGPGGVFVIDSKNWSGRLEVVEGGLRHNGRSRATTVSAATEAAVALVTISPQLRPDQVHAVLCFVRDEPLAGRVGDVLVCSTGNVVAMLTSRTSVLDGQTHHRVVADLKAGLARPAPPPVRGHAVPRARTVARRPAGRGRRTTKKSGLLAPLLVVALLLAFTMTPLHDVVADAVADVIVPSTTDTDEPPAERPREERDRPPR